MRFKCTLFRVCALVLSWTSLAPAAQAIDPSRGFVFSNRHVSFQFEPGGMGLSAMVDGESGRNHIAQLSGKHLLWKIAFGRGAQIQSITNNYKSCTQAYMEDVAGGRRAVMEWNNLRWWLEDRVVSVRVSVELPDDSGVALWRISVDNRSDYWGLWSVTFPLVNGFPRSGEYDIARPAFGSGGHLLKNWTERIEARYPAGGWPMQFLSLNRGRDAVYFASMDPSARAKDFVVEPDSALSMVHYPENMGVAGSDYPDYYAMAFGVYRGGWLEAAQRYRRWAIQQKWARKLSARSDLPDLIKNVGAWVRESWIWDRAEGSPHEMNAPLLDAQTKMNFPMAVHWHNWHQVPFDNLYPHFFPPRSGFKERVKELVDHGVLVLPYINGLSVDLNIPDFEKYAPYAMRDEAGGYRMHVYGENAGRLLSMCPTQRFWRDTVVNLAETLFGTYGVNGVYLDQISGMHQELCFNKDHGHPLGGGKYWVEANEELLRQVRAAAHSNGRNGVVASETADEAFLHLVDAHLLWPVVTDWEIPMLQVVYSGYAIFFGSPWNNFSSSDRLFNYAQGQGFINGRQGGWMRLSLFRPEYRAKAEYLRQCGEYRLAASKFLTYGRLLRPIEPVKPVPSFTEEFGGDRFIGKRRKASVPGAEGRLWQAEDGHLAAVFANYLDEPVSFAYRIGPVESGSAAQRFRLSDLRPGKTQALGVISGPVIERVETLAPRSLKVIEIAPAM